MIRGFTFERALGWPFTAPNAASFPWIYGAAYAGVFLVLYGVIGLLAAGEFTAWFAEMESLEGSDDTEAAFAAFWGGFGRLLPWAAVSTLAGWVLWAMFETASQRRYIWGAGFSLGFGADELRMMLVGLMWGLLSFALIGLPMILIMGSTFWTMFSNLSDPDIFATPEFEQRIGLQVLGVFAVMLVLGPVYIFIATRLAPCFGLTVRERRIRFFDAWNVSRGRFWPIFGAYVILAVGGGILGQVILGVAQTILMPAMFGLAEAAERGADMVALMLAPSFLIPMGIYLFIMMFVQGFLQHMVGGPAAFAVRHDPRGGVEADAQIGAFT